MSFTPKCAAIHAAADPVREALQSLSRNPDEIIRRFNPAWMAWNGQPDSILSVEVLRVHYKPQHRARMVILLRLKPLEPGGEPVNTRVYLQFYPDVETALQRQVAYRQKPSKPAAGPPSFILHDLCAIGYTLPNGPRLRRLAMLMDGESFHSFLSKKELTDYAADPGHKKLRVLRYIPRKRALLYFKPRTPGLAAAYIKHFSVDDYLIAKALHNRMNRAAADGDFQFQLPRVLAQGKLRRVIMLEELPGALLTNSYAQPNADACHAVGRAIASLHQSSVKPKIKWSHKRELAWFDKAADEIVTALPHLKDSLQRIHDWLEANRSKSKDYQRRPIHANLFGDQILVDGKNVGIVDWDDLSKGDPCFDVGRLLAHHLYVTRCVEPKSNWDKTFQHSILSGYQAEGGDKLPAARLLWHIVCALPLRAKISALRQLPEQWPAHIDRACQLAEHLIANGMPGQDDD